MVSHCINSVFLFACCFARNYVIRSLIFHWRTLFVIFLLTNELVLCRDLEKLCFCDKRLLIELDSHVPFRKKFKNKNSYEPYAPSWSELPTEMIGEIANRLPNFMDIKSFASHGVLLVWKLKLQGLLCFHC